MIHQLDEETIKRIAAGEVIERPVSVVKELVENAVDAGADSIQVSIRQGGKASISVSDNGSGIPRDEMEKAFLPHATSKINGFEDLYAVHSLGFRGEALASIIAVANVEAHSKTADEETGKSLRFENGVLQDTKTVAMATGTRMEITELFHNIPVRRKFLKSDVAESNAISRLLYSFAIGHPSIAFHFYRDDKRVLQTGKNQTLAETLLVLFGKSYHEALVPLEAENSLYHVTGAIGNNTFYRANRQMQYLFVNGRAVEEERVRDAVESCYRSLIPNGRFPAFQLFIETDPANLDVNIHPNKMKIHFADPDALEELIAQAVREALRKKPMIPGEEPEKDNLFTLSSEDSMKRLLQQYAWPTETHGSDMVVNHAATSFARCEEEDAVADTEKSEDASEESLVEFDWEEEATVPEVVQESRDEFSADDTSLLPSYDALRFVGVLFRVYVLFEERGMGSVLIMDQHAAHERVNYERFVKQFTHGAIVQQRLLKPEVLPLSDAQAAAFSERKKVLQQMGFDVEVFGDNRVVLRGVPTLFKSPDNALLLQELLDMPVNAMEEYDTLLDQMAMKACKASVKQGDSLSEAEVASLYAQLFACDYPLTCPHGRPTVIRREKKDFEKWFMRIK